MNYVVFYHKKCKKDILKASKKNPIIKKILIKKIHEICNKPLHYKPLCNDLVGERRVHILSSFVLKFIIDQNKKTITFIAFQHHDKAYK
jgi:YafQ family addiction module toxin component